MIRAILAKRKTVICESYIRALEDVFKAPEMRKALEYLATLSSEELDAQVRQELPHIHQIIKEALGQQFAREEKFMD